jgi:hypothetical protein
MSNDFRKVSYIGTGAADEFIELLPLESPERSELKRRGLTDDQIQALGVKTASPGSKDFDIAWQQIKNSGLRYIAQGDDPPGHVGLLIPSRDHTGKIVAFTIRRRKNTDQAHKYIFWKTKNGAASAAHLHMPKATIERFGVEDYGEIILAEGYLKSEIASLFLDKPIAGMNGTTLPRNAIPALKALGVVKVIMALDIENNLDTVKHKTAIQRKLEREGIRVSTLVWGGGHKGIDDALIAQADFQEVDGAHDPKTQRSGADLVYVRSVNAFINESDMASRLQTMAQVSAFYSLSPKEIKERIGQDDIERCEEFIYRPDLARGFFDFEENEQEQRAFNTYVAPQDVEVDPAKRRMIARALIEHLRFLIPEPKERKIMIQWLAHIVQRPWIRHRFMPILISHDHQVGKGLFLNNLEEVVGKTNYGRAEGADPKLFTNPFNSDSWFRKVITFVDELAQNVDSYATANSVKAKITEPTIRHEIKYIPAQTAPNSTNWIAATNNIDAMKVERMDERLCFINCAPNGAQSQEYYDRVGGIISGDTGQTTKAEVATVIRWLMRKVDLTGYNPKVMRAPWTELKGEAIEATASKGEAWAIEVFERQAWPGDLRAFRLQEITDDRAQGIVPDEIRLTRPATIGKWLRSAGFYNCTKVVRVWTPTEDGDYVTRPLKIKFWARKEDLAEFESDPTHLKREFLQPRPDGLDAEDFTSEWRRDRVPF